MYRRAALRYICHTVYWLSLAIGLLPAPMDLQTLTFHPQYSDDGRFVGGVYLLHSALVHCACLLLVLISVYAMNGKSFLPGDAILKWTYMVTNAAKGSAVALLIAELWRRRRRWLLTITDYLALAARYRRMCDDVDGNGGVRGVATNDADGNNVASAQRARARARARARIACHIERLLIGKFCISFATVWLMFISFWQMHPGDALIFAPLLLINFVLSTVLITAIDYFFYLFCQLRRHFAYIAVDLRAVLAKLRNCDESPPPLLLLALAVRVHSLTDLHYAYYRLTCRVFRLCQFTSAAIVLRMFVTNVRIVHNTLLCFVSDNAECSADNDSLSVAAGKYALMVCFYMDALLFLHVIDKLLSTCNGIDRVLSACSELPLELESHRVLAQAFERFALQVKCHRLVYRVCGLFDLDKASSLRYFLTVLIQVSVLIQFDIKLNNKRN